MTHEQLDERCIASPDERETATARAGSTRREFLCRSGGCLAVLVAGLGLTIRDVEALPAVSGGSGQAAGEKRYPIPPTDSVNIDREQALILVRQQGKVFALSLACPHQQAAVRWLPEDHRFQCTKHDSKYQPDGVYTSGRATRNMDRFPIRRDGEAVIVNVNLVFRSDQDPGGWASAIVTV